MNWELIIAIIGALSWLPAISEYFKNTEISGKIISQYANLGVLPDGNQGTIIIQRLALIAKNNNFPLNKFRVYIKYPETKEMECKNWVWRNLSFNIDGKQKHLNIKSDEYLAIRSLLPKDEVVLGYVSFSSLNDRDIRFEYVKYVFEDFQGKTKTLIFPSESIDENTQLFDDSIWSE